MEGEGGGWDEDDAARVQKENRIPETRSGRGGGERDGG